MLNKNHSDADLSLTHDELLDEVASLRARLQIAEKKDVIDKSRLRLISKDLKIGFWEWDEIENRSTYYSEEYALIFGLSLDELNSQYQTLDDLPKVYILMILKNSSRALQSVLRLV